MEESKVSAYDTIHEGDFVIIQKLHDRTYGKLVKVETGR